LLEVIHRGPDIGFGAVRGDEPATVAATSSGMRDRFRPTAVTSQPAASSRRVVARPISSVPPRTTACDIDQRPGMDSVESASAASTAATAGGSGGLP
jgi:hypothetical protein